MRVSPAAVVLLASACVVLLAACGGGDPGSAAAGAETPGARAEPPTAGAATRAPTSGDDEGVRAAKRLLGEMVAAYRSAPALVDDVVIESTMAGQTRPKQASKVMLGAGTDLRIVGTRSTLMVEDGVLRIDYANIADRYIEVELDEDAITTLRGLFGTYGGTMAQAALRYDKPLDELLFALSHGLPDQARLSGYRKISDVQDREVEQITLISAAGSVAVNVDAATKLIRSIELDYLVPESPVPNFRIRRNLTFAPRVLARLPDLEPFDPRGRLPVRSRLGLDGLAEADSIERLAVAVGDVAPDFTLHTLDGEKVVLSELRGLTVVLAFWASWNEDSRRMMHVLEAILNWSSENGMAVVIEPINILGKKDQGGRAWEAAYEVWERHTFPFPSLIDEQDVVPAAYGVEGVPMAIVIDPAGRLVGGASGLPETTLPRMQKLVSDADSAGG